MKAPYQQPTQAAQRTTFIQHICFRAAKAMACRAFFKQSLMGWTCRTLRQKIHNDRQTALSYLQKGDRGTMPKSASNEVSADGSGWNSTSALAAFSISPSEGSPLWGKLWSQVTSDDYVSLNNSNWIGEWECGDRIVLPSRLYPLTTNRGKANTSLSATKQGFLFGFHFDNGNLETSWER